jgi:carbamoyltransferase
MNILGINTGLGASVCILQDGKIIFAVEEERLVREKNCGGFPRESLAHALTEFPNCMKNLDGIGICDFEDQVMTMKELLGRYERRFSPKSPAGPFQTLRTAVANSLPPSLRKKFGKKTSSVNLVTLTREALPSLKLEDHLFFRLKHQECHAAAAYFGLAESNKPYLIFTLDGGGDKECGSISIGRDGKIEKLCTIPSAYSIGGLYSAITYLLGFKPHEHEYKIMGLAPYTHGSYGKSVYDKLSQFLKVDGITFHSSLDEKLGNAGVLYSEQFKFERFDNMASGLQRFTEDIVSEWVANAIEETGISDILLSGGVFMNVKANKKIAEMSQVSSVGIFPSCGDETNSFGIAFQIQANKGMPKLGMLKSFCLGPSPEFDLVNAKMQYSDRFSFEKIKSPELEVARLLSEGHVVAHCDGPMEFGARSLGNRSIMADPTVPGVVEKINHMIKQRDFWMPFAPALLKEDAHKYLDVPASLPKSISRYMMFGFETKLKNRSEMTASLHRSDHTARAQIVDKDIYPRFHKIISAFKKITGRGVVLNTSFNLHGLPIVMGTIDALHVLENSDLEYLVIGNTMIKKTPKNEFLH